MEGQEFLTEYRNISNKLKKRFLGRRPNVAEASEQFRQLGKRLEDSEEPQYAAFCHLATGVSVMFRRLSRSDKGCDDNMGPMFQEDASRPLVTVLERSRPSPLELGVS